MAVSGGMTDRSAPDLRIRPATAAEADEIRRIVEGAYGHYVAQLGRKPAPMLADYDELIGRGVVRVAVDADDGVIGVIVLWPEPDHLYVDNIAVDPDIRGTGAGSALLAYADEAARAAGRSEIRLYTNEAMTENLDYYPRRGYTETHRAEADGYRRVYFSRPVPPTGGGSGGGTAQAGVA